MSIQNLHKDYDHFFEKSLFETASKKYDYIFYIAIDAEWYDIGGRNNVLSYQIATTSRMGTNNIIKYMPPGKRMTLSELVQAGIDSVTTNDLEGTHNVVNLISHNFAAEWSVLADRDDEDITRHLELIRKSPVTGRSHIKKVIDKSYQVTIRIFDTMLLAPAAFKSLKKLSVLLGDKDSEKETITQHQIENMDLFLRDHPEEFERYALKDTEVTLKLFFVLQNSLNELVQTDFKLHRTLASVGVKDFLNKNDWFKDYKKTLDKDKFKNAYRLIKRAYYGGRNESYFIGRTKNYPETRDKIWIDIDFSGCYPTAMALCPKIDTEKRVEHLPLTYKIDAQTASELENDGIALTITEQVQAAHKRSVDDFNTLLNDLPKYDMAQTIRARATQTDNKLIKRWYRNWKKESISENTGIPYIVPGFARIRFKFPESTLFPCLPLRHEKYGLIYPLEGETTVSATEIMLAMDAGAEIEALTSIELPVERDAEGNPVRFTLDHLKTLAQERNRYKKDKNNPQSQIFEKLIKEFMNGFYGKFAQGINLRRMLKPSTGEFQTLSPSEITEPCTASLITSLARAALSATLMAIEDHNRTISDPKDQVTVISATTDGLLIGIPTPENFTIVGKYYDDSGDTPKLMYGVENQLPQILADFGCPTLMDRINAYRPVTLMKISRNELTGNDEAFEIKHMADVIISIKTRGQIGLLSTGQASILARFNLRPPLSEIMDDPEKYKYLMDTGGTKKNTVEAEWILENLEKIEQGSPDIPTYPFITLNSFKDILESNGTLDLTKKVTERKINTDFDWKRKLSWVEGSDDTIISPFTKPFTTLSQMMRHRDQMEAIRRTGKNASPTDVLNRIKTQGRTIRLRGGEPVAAARTFLRRMVQGDISVNIPIENYRQMADMLNSIWEQLGLNTTYPKNWKAHDIQNAKKGNASPTYLKPNILLTDLVDRLSESFGADPYTAAQSIFSFEEDMKHRIELIEQVVSAIVHGPGMMLSPLKELSDKGLLPVIPKIRERFRDSVPYDQMSRFIQKPFIPGQRPSGDTDELKRLFYSLGIPISKAQACAKAIVKQEEQKKRSSRNPGEKKCTEHFYLALQAHSSDTGHKVTDILQRLKRFGLSRYRYYEIKDGRFSPNCIKNTPKNRKQITQMAQKFEIEPTLFFELMLEK